MQKTRVVALSGELESVKSHLINAGVVDSAASPNQAVWQLKSKLGVITAYRSGKVVIQGKDEKWIDRIEELLHQSSSDCGGDLPSSEIEFVPHIGVDEAGKGDFFGPLVVGAVCVDTEAVARDLLEEGVKDSKMMSDTKIVQAAEKIRLLCPYRTVLVLNPVDYNLQNKKLRNANIILAQLHARAIEEVLKMKGDRSCTHAVIDQFSNRKSRVIDELLENGRQIEITQMHKGERDIAVAAASILAREGFISGLDALSDTYGMTFPKGASQVIGTGKEFTKRYGIEKLAEVAKISFKTALEVTSTFDI